MMSKLYLLSIACLLLISCAKPGGFNSTYCLTHESPYHIKKENRIIVDKIEPDLLPWLLKYKLNYDSRCEK